MKQKLKGCRPVNEINAEYSQVCGMFGDNQFTIQRLTKESEEMSKRLFELNLEARESHEQTKKLSEKIQPAPVEAMPEAEAMPRDASGTEYVECTTEECKAADEAREQAGA